MHFILRNIITVTACLFVSLFLPGCNTNPFQPGISQRLIIPKNHYTKINILFYESDLHTPGLAVAETKDPYLIKYKYYELGSLLVAQAPSFFQKNNIESLAFLANNSNKVETKNFVDNTSPDTPILSLIISSAQQRIVGRNTSVTLNLEGTLSGPVGLNKTRPRVWRSNFFIRLGDDPMLGILNIKSVDREFVGLLLGEIQTKLIQDGYYPRLIQKSSMQN